MKNKGLPAVWWRCARDVYHMMRVFLLLYLILCLLGITIESITPWIMTRGFELAQESLETGRGWDRLWGGIGGLCFVMSVPIVLQCISALMTAHIELKSHMLFGQRLFLKTKKLPQEAFEDSRTYDAYQIAEKCSTGNQLWTMASLGFDILERGIIMISAIAVMGTFSPWLVLIALGSVVPNLLVGVRSRKLEYRLYHKQIGKERTAEYLWGLFCKKEPVKEMRTLGFTSYLKERWVDSRDEMLREQKCLQDKIFIRVNAAHCIRNLFYGINIALSIWLMLKGMISISQLAGCIAAFSTLQGAALNLTGSMEDIVYCGKSVSDYYRYLELPEEQDGGREYPEFKGDIDMEGVTYAYPNMQENALTGVDLQVQKGEHVVIVGENGSGKTTLTKLLTGCLKPKDGMVLYDGTDIAGMRRNSLLRHISMVSQNFVRYNFTLRENIGISDVERMSDDAAVSRAIRLADLDEVKRIVGGLDGKLGREFGGSELSGGQWQKVAIARCIFRLSDIVILDEPTSALDPLIEYDILSRFMEMMKDKTAVIISHRVGICRMADKIVVMKEGRVAEIGRHEELLQKNGEYSRIWRAQARWTVEG